MANIARGITPARMPRYAAGRRALPNAKMPVSHAGVSQSIGRGRLVAPPSALIGPGSSIGPKLSSLEKSAGGGVIAERRHPNSAKCLGPDFSNVDIHLWRHPHGVAMHNHSDIGLVCPIG